MTGPSINRIVHYRSYGSADGRYKSECRAAIVTEVHGEDNVGLAVFNPTGIFFDRQVRQSEDEHTGGTWHWPCVPESNPPPPPAAYLP
jgi:hypothetical protein